MISCNTKIDEIVLNGQMKVMYAMYVHDIRFDCQQETNVQGKRTSGEKKNKREFLRNCIKELNS